MELSSIEILIILVGIVVISGGLFGLMFWFTRNSNKHRDKLYRIKHAEKRWYHGSVITPTVGEFFVRGSEHQWIGVVWDKKKKTLIVLTPPREYERMEKFPIDKYERNWRMVGECQPKPVTVEEYFVRQVM